MVAFGEIKSKSFAVFLDRDGTICEDFGYISDPKKVKLIDGSAHGIKLLKKMGYKIIIVTNQSGVGRGYFTLDEMFRVEDRLEELLREEGARIDGFYFCPHHPDENCKCRKPKTFLIEKAKEEHNIDLSHSFFIGDKMTDVLCGKRAGLRSILVLSGFGKKEAKKLIESEKPDFVAKNLLMASFWIRDQNG